MNRSGGAAPSKKTSALPLALGIGFGVVALLAAGVLLWLFVLKGKTPGSASVPEPATPGGVWASDVLGTMTPEGNVSKEGALRAFAMTYGPIPGVKTKPADASLPFCGTEVIGMLGPYYDTLEPAQKSAIATALRAGDGKVTDKVKNQGALSLVVPPTYFDLLLERAQHSATRTPSSAEQAFVERAIQEGKSFIEPHTPDHTTRFQVKLYFKSGQFIGGGSSIVGAEAFRRFDASPFAAPSSFRSSAMESGASTSAPKTSASTAR